MENVYDLLIENVRIHKCIYDKTCKDFKNIIIQAKAWNEIAEATGLTMEECRRKWIVLRERFNKEQKKRDLPTGSEAMPFDDWPYYENMLFLKDFVRGRKTRNNILPLIDTDDTVDTADIEDSTYETNMSTCSSSTANSSKNKKKEKDLPYEEARKAIKAAAEIIKAKHNVEQPPQATGRAEIGQHFMRSVLLLLEPLPDIDYDSALMRQLK